MQISTYLNCRFNIFYWYTPFSVKTYLGPSKLHGNGLFTAQDFPKGKVIWTFSKRPQSVIPKGATEVLENTQFLSEKDFDKFTPQEGKDVLSHAWAHPQIQKLLVMVDGCEWINHSEQENSRYISHQDYREVYSIALRYIQNGEEIVENYDNYKKKNIQWVKKATWQI